MQKPEPYCRGWGLQNQLDVDDYCYLLPGDIVVETSAPDHVDAREWACGIIIRCYMNCAVRDGHVASVWPRWLLWQRLSRSRRWRHAASANAHARAANSAFTDADAGTANASPSLSSAAGAADLERHFRL